MLSGSLALWYESEERQVDGHEPCIELHFNMWRELPGSASDALDIGFRIKERHAIKTLNLFIPAKLSEGEISDLSKVLRTGKTLSAVFNETLSIKDDDDNIFCAVQSNTEKVSFYVMPFDKENDINLVSIDDQSTSSGTVIQFRKALFDRMKHVGDYYIRFRINLSGPLKEIFTCNFDQYDKMFTSSFYTTDMIEFRLNERRSFPASLLKHLEGTKWPNICAVYFILIRDFKAELVRSHAGFHKMRRLENNLWADYLASLSSAHPEHMLLYHWRVKSAQETIDDFIAFASFRTVRHGIPVYIFGILFLGMLGNALESTLASLCDIGHPVAAAVSLLAAAILFFFWGRPKKISS